MSISESSRRQVEERAGCRCEYCQMPDILIYAPMEIDHIRPKVDGGVDDVSNLALACPACNNAKHAQLTAIDPTTSDVVALYNPRQEHWLDHFKIAVADAGDGVFDSGVFLQAGSFRAAGGTVSISSGNKSKLRVFPNPNHGSFHVIPAIGAEGSLTWKLYGADGNVVAGNSADANATVTGEFEVALPELKSGLYHLRVCQGGNTTSSPVLIR